MRLIKDSLRSSANRIVLISVIKNVARLLPFFMDYYRRLGVTDFIFVDNGSTDHTMQILQSMELPAAVYSCPDSYRAANYGMDWAYEALEAHCRDMWCIVADADELLVYDNCERERLPAITSYLDRYGRNAMYAYLIDMYNEKVSEYRAGTSFVEHCPYYDKLNCDFYTLPHGRFILHGGVRKRVAGVECCLGKFPLFKWTMRHVRLGWGCHFWRDATGRRIHAPAEVRPYRRRGALLHFKFLDSGLESAIRAQIAADEHWNHCAEYRAYAAAKIWEVPFFNQRYSRRFHSSRDVREFFDFVEFPLNESSELTDISLESQPRT